MKWYSCGKCDATFSAKAYAKCDYACPNCGVQDKRSLQEYNQDPAEVTA